MEKHHKEITWQAPEFQYRYKDISWYWLSAIVAVILILMAIWQKNLLFVLFIVIAEIMIIVWAKELPKRLNFKLDKEGAHIDKIKTYTYDSLEGFCLYDKDGVSELVLKTKNRIRPFVKIIIADVDSLKIKDFLKDHLPEIEYKKSLADYIEELLGF